jgi:hypothetical protein
VLRLWQYRWFKSLRFNHSSNPHWQLLAKYYIITGMIMILVVVGTRSGVASTGIPAEPLAKNSPAREPKALARS